MVMINTGLGHITAEDGLAMFQRAQSSQGPLLGIYMQLIKFDKERAHKATKMVLANRTSYSAKIQRIAKEQVAGHPIGAKAVTSAKQVFEILKSAGLRATLRIRFREDRPRQVLNITLMSSTGLIKFHDENAFGILIQCVAVTGYWDKVPRTYMIDIDAQLEEQLGRIADAFAATIESVEIVHCTPEQTTVWPGTKVDEVLAEHPELFFDRGIFNATCKAIGLPISQITWFNSRISDSNAPMQTVMIQIPVSHKGRFLDQYIKQFELALATA